MHHHHHLLNNNSRHSIYSASLRLGQMGLRVSLQLTEVGRDIFSGLADKLKKKNPQLHNPLFRFIPQSRNHGLFPAVSRGPQNPAHGGFLQHPAMCDEYRTWPFQRCCLQSMCHGLLYTTSDLPQIQPLYQPWGFSKGENLYSSSTRH